MKPLKIFAIGAEATVILTLAVSSYHIAFSGASGVDWLAGAPILTVVALETLRLPLAFNLRRASLFGIALSVAIVGGLSVITGEAASLAFENLIFQRTRPVVEAEAALKKVSIGHDTLDTINDRRADEIKRLTADLAAARDHRAEIDKPIEMQPVASDRLVTRRDKKGRSFTVNLNSGVQSTTVNGNAAAQAAHSAELKAASDQVAKAQQALAGAEANKPDMHVSDEAVKQAKQNVADARSMNPMYRVAAAWQKVPVQELTPEQFEQVKHYAVMALAISTAITSALVAFVSSLPERGSGKLAKAMRAMFAARRKTIRRINERVVTEFRDRTKVVYVPVDIATGKVLDPAFQHAPSATPNLKVV